LAGALVRITTSPFFFSTDAAQPPDLLPSAAAGQVKTPSKIRSTHPLRGEKVPYPGHDLKFPAQTNAQEKLRDWTAVFNCIGRPDAYFEESLALLRTVKNQHAEVISKLALYLQHAKGELLRCEISQEIERRGALIRSMKKKEPTKSKKVEKTNAGTKR
jgi:hypothetical protein